jgi:polyhydroxybutyrate depolymerase
LHVPPRLSDPAPLVLVLHGGDGTAEATERFSGFSAVADANGFLAVYPNGTGRLEKVLTWNGGNCCGYAMHNKVDDVAFTTALLDDLAKVVKVDATRVYATGMSNGAILAHRLASELSDRIAAIAPVSGPMVIHFHGTDDKFAPFQGGKGEKSLSGTDFFSVEHSIRAWVKANSCMEEPATDKLPDTARDGTKVLRKTYGGGKDGAEVVLVVIEGGGHTWPGREPTLKLLGKTTKNVSANDLMWDFFQRHPMN